MNEVEDKLSRINKMSPSQIDRIELQDKFYSEIMSFLSCLTTQLKSKSSLKTLVENELTGRIENEEEDPVPFGTLMTLLDILNKDDTSKVVALLNAVAKTTQPAIQEDPKNPTKYGERKNDSLYTQEETEAAKRLIKVLTKLEQTEFPEKKK